MPFPCYVRERPAITSFISRSGKMAQGVAGPLESSKVMEKNQACHLLRSPIYNYACMVRSPIYNCACMNLSSKCNEAVKPDGLLIHCKRRVWVGMLMQVQERNGVILACCI